MALTSSEHWLTFSSELTFFPFGKVNAFCASHSAKISKMMTDSVSEPHTSSQQLHFPRLTIKLMVFHFVSNEIWKQWFVYHVIWRWISLYNSFIWTVYEAGARVRNFILAFHGFQFRILSPCVQSAILVSLFQTATQITLCLFRALCPVVRICRIIFYSIRNRKGQFHGNNYCCCLSLLFGV